VIAVDPPGFGSTPLLLGEASIRSPSNAVTAFLDALGLRGVYAQSSSMRARPVFELTCRGGVLGSVVSLK
jgi:pimeloyl-ACP methyl ester carboxylesterase